MKTSLLFSFYILILLSAVQVNAQSKYVAVFGSDYKHALEYMTENRILQMKIMQDNDIPAEILLPVVFPERIRYSIIKDYFETEMLKTVYVRYGSAYADFSVGDFQLKASFAEKIEQFVIASEELSEKYSLLIIASSGDKDRRKIRVKRLQNTAYQLYYISAFYDIVNRRFDLSKKAVNEKIRFIASAYNHGFTDSQSEIEKYAGKKFFPYGSKYPGKQYAYSDVAADFYRYHFKPIYNGMD
ncbi:MAG: hypothetical protein U9N85_05875 [Bacteroidota bacterium]|nr:hypothetical protein [Bacteroidota bacterium]